MGLHSHVSLLSASVSLACEALQGKLFPKTYAISLACEAHPPPVWASRYGEAVPQALSALSEQDGPYVK
jgi:hypothetical protein